MALFLPVNCRGERVIVNFDYVVEVKREENGGCVLYFDGNSQMTISDTFNSIQMILNMD